MPSPSPDPKGPAPAIVEVKPTAAAPFGPGSTRSPFDQNLASEVEPNGTSATATPIAGASAVIQGNVFPNADVDFYSFTGAVGDRVYAAVMTSFSASASVDSVLDLIAPDGTTIIETDLDDGSFGASSSSIAGRALTAAGTHFIRVRHQSATGQLRPYRLYFQLRSGAPTPETESNDTFPGQALPAGGWVSGATSALADIDLFSIALAAGDTVFLSLDLDPERDTVEWNGQLGLGAFGTPASVLVVSDAGAATPDSEAFFMTVQAAGTYGIMVNVPTGGTTIGTYHVSVTVFPDVSAGCTTYTSTNVPVAIPTGPAIVTSTLTVPGNPRIEDLDVILDLTHNFMADLDVELTAPPGIGGNTVGLFTDVGSVTAGAQVTMDTTIDDEAGVPIGAFTIVQGPNFTPELAFRTAWFDGQDAGGTWTLTIRDDATGDGGALTGWSLRICEPPPAPPACAPGFTTTTVFSTDFEGGAAGFTHSGVQDEWALGTPSGAPIIGCNSGTSCFETDLAGSYNASSNQDLLSPNINLAGLAAPIVVNWAQKYQIESATFDHLLIEAREVGNPTNAVRFFEWLGATMTNTVGNPGVTVQESAGWGQFSARADSLAGLNSELRFHLDSDTTVQLAGLAIDDVIVTACRPVAADLSITKSDGVATAVPGGSVTYTITATNPPGGDPVTGATVADTFPPILTCTWTCVGAGGTCTAAGSGSINDIVDLPTNSSVTYTASCTIAASATGTLSNTATVSSSVTDPDATNNSATDTDTLTPQADLSITKTDGVANATPGGSVTYTITASNAAGPSNAPGSTVSDTFPPALTCTWTCVGAGGTCTAAGAGNISDTVNLPSGGSVTYTASCTISPTATGTLVNTATVTAPAGVTDSNSGNDSATDTDNLTVQLALNITKTDGLTTASPGQASTYTIVASNGGPSTATGATVTDTFPAGFTGATWTCSGALGGTCTAAGAGNINDLVTLPAGSSVTYVVNGTIDAAFIGTLSNTATITLGPDTASATDVTQVSSASAVSGTKSVSGSFATGGTVTYTVILNNGGVSAQLDNPGDEFVDTLPAQLTLVGATATSGTATTVGNTAHWNGAIPAGGSVTITITATVNPGTAGQTVSNQGTINYDADGNGTNESAGVTDDPTQSGGADPTNFVAGGILEIPTLSQIGLLALALMLGALAFVTLRRMA